MNEQPSPEVMAQAKAAGLRRGDSFSYSNDPKAAAAYHPGSAPVTRPDLDALITKMKIYADLDDRAGFIIRSADWLDAAAALAAERARADQADILLRTNNADIRARSYEEVANSMTYDPDAWGDTFSDIRRELRSRASSIRRKSAAPTAEQGADLSRCAKCRHAEHDGFECLNMASDNDCACTYGFKQGADS